MSASVPRTVPLVPSLNLSEFGDIQNTAAFNERAGQDRDLSYVPGFSDLKRAREMKVAAFHHGTATMTEVRALDLPVNVRWARNQNRKGEPDNTKSFSHQRSGYRMATKKDVGTAWLKELPAGASYGVGDCIRNGDTVLMVCDKESAAQNVQRKANITQERLVGAQGAFAQNLAAANVSVKGSDPYITKVDSPTTNTTNTTK